MLCRYCGKRQAAGGVFCRVCSQGRPRRLTEAQYLSALVKIRDRIASDVAIGLDDSNAVGEKHTHCAWGICTDSAKVWSDSATHIWPMDFIEQGRVAPLDRPCSSKCPLDERWRYKASRVGCFYSCLAFRPPKGFTLTTEHALRLYDTEISRTGQNIRREAIGAQG